MLLKPASRLDVFIELAIIEVCYSFYGFLTLYFLFFLSSPVIVRERGKCDSLVGVPTMV